jgi:hypothetical protein
MALTTGTITDTGICLAKIGKRKLVLNAKKKFIAVIELCDFIA